MPPGHAKAQERSERDAGTGAAVRAKIGAWHSVAGTTRRRNMVSDAPLVISSGHFLWSPETTRVAGGGGGRDQKQQERRRQQHWPMADDAETRRSEETGGGGRSGSAEACAWGRRGWRHCPSLRVAWKRDEWSRDMMVFAGIPDDADWWRRGRGRHGTGDGGEAREERRTRRTGR